MDLDQPNELMEMGHLIEDVLGYSWSNDFQCYVYPNGYLPPLTKGSARLMFTLLKNSESNK